MPQIAMCKWSSISDQIRAGSQSERPKRDRIRLAYHFKKLKLLDSEVVTTRAEFARHLHEPELRQS